MHEGENHVGIASCNSYGVDEVESALKRSIQEIGGISKFIKPGSRVIVKPNLLMGESPEKVVTTHPSVVRAVVKLLLSNECQVIIADSPGAGITYSKNNLKKVYSVTGLQHISEELGVPLNYDISYQVVPSPDSRTMKMFPIITPALEADAIVVVSKAKTHTFTMYSGAAKNLFGLIPGLEKPAFHARFQTPSDFARMIIDLNLLIRPALEIMDAVVGMEGDGPMAGNPRKIGALLASADFTAIDIITATLMGFSPLKIGTIEEAVNRGLAPSDFSQIKTSGEDVSKLVVNDFKKPPGFNSGNGALKQRIFIFMMARLGRVYPLYPKPDKNRCTGCAKCFRACPVNAIKMQKNKAIVNLKHCIRCYCCHEMCDSRAIDLQSTLIRRFLDKLTS